MSEVVVTPQSMQELERFEKTAGMLSWLSSCDHKQIGILYLLTAVVFFIVGGCEALVMRLQLAVANNHFLKPETYDQLFTLHGTTMIFLVIMPTLLGFSVYLLPLMIGARDMAFPRMNALSYWLLLFGGIFLYTSIFFGNAPTWDGSATRRSVKNRTRRYPEWISGLSACSRLALELLPPASTSS